MNCPVCNIPLLITERQSVEIDYCQKCRGVWLDRGELDKIIEHSQSEQPSRPYPERFDDNQDRHHDKHHDDLHEDHRYKKRSFFSELFD